MNPDAVALEPTAVALYSAHETALIDPPCTIGRGTAIGPFAHVMKGARIGADCRLGHGVVVAPTAMIGAGVHVGDHVSVCDGVVLEDHVFCSPGVAFTNQLAPRSEDPRGLSQFSCSRAPASESGTVPLPPSPSSHPSPPSPPSPGQPTLVKRGATLGANATILCGLTVGDYALVAAGAVVTRDVPCYAVAAGVPARPIGWVCRCGVGRLKFDEGSLTAYCAPCGRHYRMQVGHGPYEYSPEKERAQEREHHLRVEAAYEARCDHDFQMLRRASRLQG